MSVIAEDDELTRPDPTPRVRAVWTTVAAATTAILLAVMYVWDSAFFLVDDKRFQYLPVAMDIGRRLRAGEWLPVIDPSLGPSGNYSLDIQYGVFEPTHWVVAIALSWFTNLELAAFVWALCFSVLLTVGTAVLAYRLAMPGAWPAVAGLSVAMAGWILFWLVPDWIPGLVSLAWLPWLWWAWVGGGERPRARDCIGIAVFSYLVVAGGWPSTWMAAAALVVGLVVEAVVRRSAGSRRRAWLGPLALRCAASLAGVISGALTLIPLYHAGVGHFTVREGHISNDNFLIVNLWDVLSFAAPQLTGDVSSFGGKTTLTVPVFFTAWFAVVAFWCVRWDRRMWRRPGVVAAFVGCILMLLLTQSPSIVGPLRDQIRQLEGVQFFFVIGVCALACRGAWVVTKARAAAVLLTLAAMGCISWARTPNGLRGAEGILLVMVAALVLLLVGARAARFVVVGTLVSIVALTVVAFGLHHQVTSTPGHELANRLTPGRLHLTTADEPILAIYAKGTPPEWVVWQRDGVGRAFGNLRAVGRMSPGYSSIGQRAYRARFCIEVAQGNGCPSQPARLFHREPTTSVPWVDLLGYRTIVIQSAVRQRVFERAAGPQWRLVDSGAAFKEYQRSGPVSVAGRITHIVGRASVRTVSLSNETQTYDVAARTRSMLVFRDLYWPGYQATLNGHPMPVHPLDSMLITVALPPGSHGRLTVSYVPLHLTPVVVLPAASLVLLSAVSLAAWRRHRDDSSSAAVHGDEHARQPGDTESLQNPV